MDQITGEAQVVGIWGDPLAQSLSPKMHNFAFKALGLNWIYVPFQVRAENLKAAVESLRALNFVGVNVTIPHKENVVAFLDELSPIAQQIGAVNTIVNRQGKLCGDNTDAPGFLNAIKEQTQFNPKSKRAVLLGAGAKGKG